MNKLTLITALIATTLSSAAVAADWVRVGAGVAGNIFYVDRESIRTMPNGYKRAWVRVVYSEPINGPAGVADTSEVLMEYDCDEGRSRSIELTFFRGDEFVIRERDASGWSYIRPDSVSNTFMEYVCSR